ncbi:MAG: Asp-tRNA(Asn)/Glu-tRNA(Gln) amidotransferase subunit GatC [Magnetococcales bacterium]|nr:Asp-tRNA(Asn)/Glu-tRNA(Gln) amidotransferase subunit GatC [Magnetococcales bacterium]
MAITDATVRKVAALARLDLPEDQVATWTRQLSDILELMQRLDAIPTAGVEPMSHAIDLALPERDDVVTNGNQREALLACAPEAENGHFRVPKIIE